MPLTLLPAPRIQKAIYTSEKGKGTDETPQYCNTFLFCNIKSVTNKVNTCCKKDVGKVQIKEF